MDSAYYSRKAQGERRVAWSSAVKADPTRRGYKFFPLWREYTPIERRIQSLRRFVAYVRRQGTDFVHAYDLEKIQSRKYRDPRVFWAEKSRRGYSYRAGLHRHRLLKRSIIKRNRRNRQWRRESDTIPAGRQTIRAVARNTVEKFDIRRARRRHYPMQERVEYYEDSRAEIARVAAEERELRAEDDEERRVAFEQRARSQVRKLKWRHAAIEEY